ncbi:MarR family winged helix-turn-helix transcriptional regulator [Mucilaginibacter sp.]|uniref:MarR family winged helix-turn-helix transcriptional regulator n=1 Tax=Mucilaginibacter sp. TaxID=1882438 RepID=UPI002617CA8A|nr:MarR family winged helix-turn-helix transcriptional regulator [Mucilaginibacter sp.]MDB4923543.1 MarR family transcriptional regulator [Mucilaginibacter sp.]
MNNNEKNSDYPEYLLSRLVTEMERTADKLLMASLGLSFTRCQYLAILYSAGTITQHNLAVIIGHSDPSVSKMLGDLEKKGFVSIEISPLHGRKRLVSLTKIGEELMHKGTGLLHEHFDSVIKKAGIDGKAYAEQTKKLWQSLLSLQVQ